MTEAKLKGNRTMSAMATERLLSIAVMSLPFLVWHCIHACRAIAIGSRARPAPTMTSWVLCLRSCTKGADCSTARASVLRCHRWLQMIHTLISLARIAPFQRPPFTNRNLHRPFTAVQFPHTPSPFIFLVNNNNCTSHICIFLTTISNSSALLVEAHDG